VEIAQGYAPAGHLYSEFWQNLSKNFSFGGPIPLPLHWWGEIWWFSPPWQISHPSVQRVTLAGRETSKSPSALCAVRKAAGNKKTTDWCSQKQNLLQFTACSN